jgi:tripartite-type tricarboxylate transporter receptor subunit TctC
MPVTWDLMMRRARLTVLAIAGFLPGALLAQTGTGDYPTRPVRLIVPFATGGVIDVVARLVAPKLGDALGQPVVVENRPGAAGNIAGEAVARATPDGHTLLVGGTGFALNPSLQPGKAIDVIKELAPIGLLNRQQYALVAGPTTRANNVLALVALAKASPGKLSCGVSGVGTMAHLATELFKAVAGIDVVSIPYKGSGPMIPDLLSGELAFAIDPVASHLANIRAGKVRALAVAGATRSALLPDVPTFAEAGVQLEASGWVGLFAPAGTPTAVVLRLNEETKRITAIPDVRELFERSGVEAASSASPAEFTNFVRSEGERWGRIIRERGITI